MSRIAGLLLLAALAVAPFLNGAVSDAAWAVVAVATVIAAAGGLAGRSPGPGLVSLRGASRAWWVVLAALVALQVVPLPHGLLRLLSPARADLAETVAAVTAPETVSREPETGSEKPETRDPKPNPPPTPLSLDPEATLLALAQIVTLAVLFALLTQRARRPAPPTPLVPIPSLVEPGGTVDIQAHARSHSLFRTLAQALHPKRPLLHDLLLPALVLAATLQAALVLVQYAARLSGSAVELPLGLGLQSGTYVNRNGLGNLLALALPVTAGLLLARLRRVGKRVEGVGGHSVADVLQPVADGVVSHTRVGDRFRLRPGEDENGLGGPAEAPEPSQARRQAKADFRTLAMALAKSGAGWLILALAVQSAGVVLSLSRGATAAAAAALGVLLLAAGLRFRSVAGPLAAWGVPLLFALAVGSLLGLDSVLARWASLEKDPEGGRLEWWGAAWGLFRAFPVLGAGLGGYLDGATAFRGPESPFYHAEHAHSDYAEALAVLGLPGALLAAAALALAGLGAARAVRHGSLRRMGLGAGLIAFAGHAAVDFPLAYGANAAWAVACWALLMRPGRREEAMRLRGERRKRRRHRQGSLRDLAGRLPALVSIGALAAAGLAAWAPILAAMSELTIAPARDAAREVRETGAPAGAKGSKGEAWRGAFSAPLAAASETAAGRFRRAEAHRLVATLLGGRAAGDAAAGLPPEETAHTLRRALAASAAALALRPAAAEAWAEHAALLRAAGVGGLFEADSRRPSPTESAPTRVGGLFEADSRRLPPTESAPTRVGGRFRPRPGEDENGSGEPAEAQKSSQARRRAAADLAIETAVRLAPASPRVALREAVYWLDRSRDAEPVTPDPEPGTRDNYRLRSQQAYQRLLSVNGLPAPERFLRDAWRRSGSVDFLLACIHGVGGALGPDSFPRARRLLELADGLVTNEGRLDEIAKVEAALEALGPKKEGRDR